MSAGTGPTVGLFSMWHNRAEVAEPSLSSALAQSYPNIRFVFVDDGSTDDTLSRIEAVAKAHGERDITVLSWANRGFTASLMAAIAQTDCDLVAILDAGDISHPERIARQVALARSDPDAAIIGAHVGLYKDGALSEAAERVPVDVPAGPPATDRLPMPGTHGAVLFRRDLHDEVGGYRPAFRYCQDADLWLRLLPLGHLRIVPELLHWRYESPSTITGTPRRQIVQRHYQELALQCADARARGEPDPVERYGADAVFFIEKTQRFSRSLGDLAKRLSRAGHPEESRIASRLALRYAPEFRTRLRAMRRLMRASAVLA